MYGHLRDKSQLPRGTPNGEHTQSIPTKSPPLQRAQHSLPHKILRRECMEDNYMYLLHAFKPNLVAPGRAASQMGHGSMRRAGPPRAQVII